MLLFCIYDRVAGTFSEPIAMLKKELAIRRFNYLMQQSPMVAQDCDLFLVGSFDQDSGCLTALAKPEFVCRYEVKSNE